MAALRYNRVAETSMEPGKLGHVYVAKVVTLGLGGWGWGVGRS